jgi:hypothetical protein
MNDFSKHLWQAIHDALRDSDMTLRLVVLAITVALIYLAVRH